MRQVLVLVITASLAVGVGAQPALGQEAVGFQLKLAKGEVLYAAFAARGELSMQLNAVRQTSTFQVEGREATRVLEVESDGTMLIEVVMEELRLREGNRTEEILDAPITMKVRPDGRIAEKQVGSLRATISRSPCPAGRCAWVRRGPDDLH